MILVVCLTFVFGVLAATVAAFAIGKYNLLVALRRRISNEMLQFDFTLRKQSAELRTLGNNSPAHKPGDLLPTDFFSTLDRAEEYSHRAVAGRLCGGGLARLGTAKELVASCWNIIPTAGRDDIARIARCRLKSNEETWKKICGLVVHYGDHAGKIPCCWVAFASGFESLATKNFLSGKTNGEMLPSNALHADNIAPDITRITK